MKITRALAATAALTAGFALTAVPASATQETEACHGLDNQSSVDNIVVKSGESCYLNGSWVRGNITVEDGGSLYTDGVRIMGTMKVGTDAAFSATRTTVVGGVHAKGALLDLQNSKVIGPMHRSGESTIGIPATTYLEGSRVVGYFASKGGINYLQDSEVYSSVYAYDGDYTDIYNSYVGNRTSVRGMENGATVCGGVLNGAVQFYDNSLQVDVGPTADRGLCDGTTKINSGAIFSGNANLQISDTTFASYVTGSDNAPAPVIGDGVTAASATRQFEGLIAKPAAPEEGEEEAAASQLPVSALSEDVKAKPSERRAALRAMLDARRAATIKAATEAGTAFQK